jgi:hypothetical protein
MGQRPAYTFDGRFDWPACQARSAMHFDDPMTFLAVTVAAFALLRFLYLD